VILTVKMIISNVCRELDNEDGMEDIQVRIVLIMGLV